MRRFERALLRFPGERVASFMCGFGQTKVSEYRVIGSEGMLKMDPGYTWQGDIVLTFAVKGKEETHTFEHRDQVAAEILYFADCIQTDVEPEPSGQEGLIDVRIIEALRQSYSEHRPIRLEPSAKTQRPDQSQSIERPPGSPAAGDGNGRVCRMLFSNVGIVEQVNKFLADVVP